VNFSSGICEPLTASLCVLPVPDVGWSDWGTAASILRTLKKLGHFDAFSARLEQTRLHPGWHSSRLRPAHGDRAGEPWSRLELPASAESLHFRAAAGGASSATTK
jgi:hypothetical protein